MKIIMTHFWVKTSAYIHYTSLPVFKYLHVIGTDYRVHNTHRRHTYTICVDIILYLYFVFCWFLLFHLPYKLQVSSLKIIFQIKLCILFSMPTRRNGKKIYKHCIKGKIRGRNFQIRSEKLTRDLNFYRVRKMRRG